MRTLLVLTTFLFLISASIVGCSGQLSSVQRSEARHQRNMYSGQSTLLNPNELPRINPRCINMTLRPRDRVVFEVMCSAGRLPRGTRLYVSDVIAVRDGNRITLPTGSQTISKRSDGSIVLLNAQGEVIQTFPKSAVIQVQKGAQAQAIQPGKTLPNKYEHSTPAMVIK